jgi:hypothetical protein
MVLSEQNCDLVIVVRDGVVQRCLLTVASRAAVHVSTVGNQKFGGSPIRLGIAGAPG